MALPWGPAGRGKLPERASIHILRKVVITQACTNNAKSRG